MKSACPAACSLFFHRISRQKRLHTVVVAPHPTITGRFNKCRSAVLTPHPHHYLLFPCTNLSSQNVMWILFYQRSLEFIATCLLDTKAVWSGCTYLSYALSLSTSIIVGSCFAFSKESTSRHVPPFVVLFFHFFSRVLCTRNLLPTLQVKWNYKVPVQTRALEFVAILGNFHFSPWIFTFYFFRHSRSVQYFRFDRQVPRSISAGWMCNNIGSNVADTWSCRILAGSSGLDSWETLLESLLLCPW